MVGSSAWPCQARTAPVRSRKNAATPASKRAICPPVKGIRRLIDYGQSAVEFNPATQRSRTGGETARLRHGPGVASGSISGPRLASRAASLARAVSGRSRRGKRVPGKLTQFFRRPMHHRQTSATHIFKGKQPSSRCQVAGPPPRASRPPMANSFCATNCDPLGIRFFIEQCRPAIFKPSQHRPCCAARQQFGRHGLQPRLRRWWIGVKPLAALLATRRGGSRPAPARVEVRRPPRPAHRRWRTAHRRRAAARPASKAGRGRGHAPRQRYETALAAFTTSSALISASFSRLAA